MTNLLCAFASREYTLNLQIALYLTLQDDEILCEKRIYVNVYNLLIKART